MREKARKEDSLKIKGKEKESRIWKKKSVANCICEYFAIIPDTVLNKMRRH
jgi:hypothetical protein